MCGDKKHVDIPGFTWSNPSMKIQGRLDYFLLPKNAQHLISNCKIVPNIFSDHSALFTLGREENFSPPWFLEV